MKIALVMGSSRGIGRAIALKLHMDGFVVVVTYCYDEDAGRKVFNETGAKGLWKFVINSKLDSSFLVPKSFYPLLKKSKAPHIILNTSSVDERPQMGALAYSVASAGVANLTKSLALELGPEGFRVNAICPGTTRTDNWIGFGRDDDAMWKRFAKSNPMRRVPLPEDIAEAVSYLVSEKAKYINGLFLYIDGGNRHRSG